MVDRLPAGTVRRILLRSAILAGVACMCGLLVLAQTAQKTKKAPKKPASRAALRADSVARAAADSLRRALHTRVAADSSRRSDSLAAARRVDSLTTPGYRKVINNAFGVGEQLLFNVNYGFVTAGEAAMRVVSFDSIAGRKTYRIQFTVNSLPSFSWIYRVEDRYLTFIDVEAIAPLRFEQHIQEGSYRRDFTADFDHLKKIARTSEGEHPIPEYVHDILSAFYYVRTVDFSTFKVGHLLLMKNFYSDTSYDLAVKFLGRQELEVEAGTFRTLVVEPMVKEGGLFKSEGRIVVWLTDDDRKVPIRVNTKVVIGSIDVELREYSGFPAELKGRVK